MAVGQLAIPLLHFPATGQLPHPVPPWVVAAGQFFLPTIAISWVVAAGLAQIAVPY